MGFPHLSRLEVSTINNNPQLSIPAKAGTHFYHGHRPEFILGPAFGRTRGPVWSRCWQFDNGVTSRGRQESLRGRAAAVQSTSQGAALAWAIWRTWFSNPAPTGMPSCMRFAA
jgi:hypothetical protein